MIHIWVDIVYFLCFIVCNGYWCIHVCFFGFFWFFCIYVSSFCILWVASIVDLRVFWQPGSVTIVLKCHDCCLFESNKYLLLLHHHLWRYLMASPLSQCSSPATEIMILWQGQPSSVLAYIGHSQSQTSVCSTSYWTENTVQFRSITLRHGRYTFANWQCL